MVGTVGKFPVNKFLAHSRFKVVFNTPYNQNEIDVVLAVCRYILLLKHDGTRVQSGREREFLFAVFVEAEYISRDCKIVSIRNIDIPIQWVYSDAVGHLQIGAIGDEKGWLQIRIGEVEHFDRVGNGIVVHLINICFVPV